MIRFKCNGQPYVDPWHQFTIEDWEFSGHSREGEPKFQTDIDRAEVVGVNSGFKISPGQPINTSVFEEAIIV